MIAKSNENEDEKAPKILELPTKVEKNNKKIQTDPILPEFCTECFVKDAQINELLQKIDATGEWQLELMEKCAELTTMKQKLALVR